MRPGMPSRKLISVSTGCIRADIYCAAATLRCCRCGQKQNSGEGAALMLLSHWRTFAHCFLVDLCNRFRVLLLLTRYQGTGM